MLRGSQLNCNPVICNHNLCIRFGVISLRITDKFIVAYRSAASPCKPVISGVSVKILELIKRENFVENFQVIEDNKQGQIKVYLKYLDDGTPVMEGLKRVSTSGRREYVPAKKVKTVMGGVGMAIVSTSKGLLTDEEARQQGVGGEVICRVW